MEEDINIKISELIELLNNDIRIKKLSTLKEELKKDDSLIRKIELLKKMNEYTNEYQNLKKKIFKNNKFVEYKELENEINFLILEINQKLKKLTNKKGCLHENN